MFNCTASSNSIAIAFQTEQIESSALLMGILGSYHKHPYFAEGFAVDTAAKFAEWLLGEDLTLQVAESSEPIDRAIVEQIKEAARRAVARKPLARAKVRS